MSACGFNANLPYQARVGDVLLQHNLGHRRSTDIAHAHYQEVDHRLTIL